MVDCPDYRRYALSYRLGETAVSKSKNQKNLVFYRSGRAYFCNRDIIRYLFSVFKVGRLYKFPKFELNNGDNFSHRTFVDIYQKHNFHLDAGNGGTQQASDGIARERRKIHRNFRKTARFCFYSCGSLGRRRFYDRGEISL